MKIVTRISAIILFFACVISCKTNQKISGEYAIQLFETQLISRDPSGFITLRTWGNGTNRSRAMEQAEIRALETIIFNGLTGHQVLRPLVKEVNARERHQKFFDAFFSDKANCNRFVTLDEKTVSRIKSENLTMEQWGCIVRIDYNALQTFLIDEGIIKK